MKVLLGTKIGMTQLIDKNGTVTPVTILQAGPVSVTQVKTTETDGYNAIQLGFGTAKKSAKTNAKTETDKAETVEKSADRPQFLREFRAENLTDRKTGDTWSVEVFQLGDKVKVTGISKGKGFAGTVKRWNFNESRHSHGFKGHIRRVGSIGSMYPQKVFRGKRMPGRMGHATVSVKNLTVAFLDPEKNLLGLKGAVPGPNKGLILIEGKES